MKRTIVKALIIILIALAACALFGCQESEPAQERASEPIGARVANAIQAATANTENFTADIKIELYGDGRESARIYIELNGGTGENYSGSDYSLSSDGWITFSKY